MGTRADILRDNKQFLKTMATVGGCARDPLWCPQDTVRAGLFVVKVAASVTVSNEIELVTQNRFETAPRASPVHRVAPGARVKLESSFSCELPLVIG